MYTVDTRGGGGGYSLYLKKKMAIYSPYALQILKLVK